MRSSGLLYRFSNGALLPNLLTKAAAAKGGDDRCGANRRGCRVCQRGARGRCSSTAGLDLSSGTHRCMWESGLATLSEAVELCTRLLCERDPRPGD